MIDVTQTTKLNHIDSIIKILIISILLKLNFGHIIINSFINYYHTT